MTPPEQPTPSWAPKPAALWAWLVFALVALTLFTPMLTGQFLAGDDQVLAGYGFREFAAEYFRAHHAIPQWNPFLFGGLPFFGVIGHGDIFYPTAWLRWVVSTDLGMTLGFFVHLIIAGGAMYALLRGLKLSWTAAVVGGVAYELTGMVASQISPGHDGKLFVMALAPFVFLTLLRGIRHRRLGAFGWLAILVGLVFLSPQVQTAYYLLVGAGLWTLWLVFLDPERVTDRSPVTPMALALGGVLLGVGIAMIQLLPIFSYIQYTPRGQGGPSLGWAVCHQLLLSHQGTAHPGDAAVQRHAGALLGRQLLQVAHRVSRGAGRGPRHHRARGGASPGAAARLRRDRLALLPGLGRVPTRRSMRSGGTCR